MVKIKEKSFATGKVKCILTDVRTGKEEITETDNIVVTVGKVAIARRLGDIALLANEGKATYGATGTNVAVPVVGDTQLGTELFRKVFASTSIVGSIITFVSFYTTAESNGVLTEFGLFGEAATGAANSGTMFNHAVISVPKDATKTLRVEVSITIS